MLLFFLFLAHVTARWVLFLELHFKPKLPAMKSRALARLLTMVESAKLPGTGWCWIGPVMRPGVCFASLFLVMSVSVCGAAIMVCGRCCVARVVW